MPPKFKYHISPIREREHFRVGDVLRVGRVYGMEGTIPLHSHNHYEWCVINKGSAVHSINGFSCTLTAGDIVLSFPGDLHVVTSVKSDPPDYDFVSIDITDPALSRLMAPIAIEYGAPEGRVVHSERIKNVIFSIIAEANERSELYDNVISSLVEQLCVYTVRKLKKVRMSYLQSVSSAESLCYRIMNYINTNIYTIKKLSDICEITSYNYNYLSNLFKRVTSKTLMDYYTERRLECANAHLAEGKHTVTEIAAMLGYSSVYVFSRAYKKYFGISPTDYKKTPII